MSVKEDYAILTDGKITPEDGPAIRRLAQTVPMVAGLIVTFLTALAALLTGGDAPAAPADDPVQESDTDTDTE